MDLLGLGFPQGFRGDRSLLVSTSPRGQAAGVNVKKSKEGAPDTQGVAREVSPQ